jgi:hypothetical protein
MIQMKKPFGQPLTLKAMKSQPTPQLLCSGAKMVDVLHVELRRYCTRTLLQFRQVIFDGIVIALCIHIRL